MIQRTIAGLQWHAISPSFYALALYPKIDLSYVGDIWYLSSPRDNGEPFLQGFDSRDDAAAFVARYLRP